jgi:uncharacterized protein (TIGR00369 family)
MNGTVTMNSTADRPQLWREMEDIYGASPIHRILGLTLRVPGAGQAIVEYDGRSDAGNRLGIAAGGALAEMIDSASFQACRTLLEPDDHIITLEAKINFLRPGEAGIRLEAVGVAEHVGRTTAVGTARILTPEKKVVAMGTVTLSIKRGSAGKANTPKSTP